MKHAGGRPTEPTAKRLKFQLRLTETDAERLDRCAAELDKSRSETLLYGLWLVSEELQSLKEEEK